ncbi:MAG: adenosine deaminase [Candidatus Bathyarchaeota archaeon]|nr:MAG: adenosine deaminase [Candidatus Bathyarchaeota archaeon]
MDALELIRALPKAEQHIHIVGSTRPETLLWLVEEGDLDTPFKTPEDVERFFRYIDFNHFISVYNTMVHCITEEAQFERIVFEMLEDEAHCNVRYVEASFSAPDHVLIGLDYGLMLDAINKGIHRAKDEFCIDCQIRIDLVRNYGPERGMEILDWIEAKSENIVSIDIGGSETSFPPEPYEAVYERAGEMGLHLVAHGGETAGPVSVWGAVEKLKVERIGHGVAARRDPRLMDFLAEKGITVEACPVSNVRTGAVSSVREHPIREFIDRGIRVTVNSDDPSMFGTDMNNEYIQLHEQLGFTVPELFQMSLNAVESSFLPDREKGRMREDFMRMYWHLNDRAETFN